MQTSAMEGNAADRHVECRSWQQASSRCEWTGEGRNWCSPGASDGTRTATRQRRLNRNAAGSDRRGDYQRREYQRHGHARQWHQQWRSQRWREEQEWQSWSAQQAPQESAEWRWQEQEAQLSAAQASWEVSEVSREFQRAEAQRSLEEIQQEVLQLLDTVRRWPSGSGLSSEASLQNLWDSTQRQSATPQAATPQGTTMFAVLMTCRRSRNRATQEVAEDNPSREASDPSPPVTSMLGTTTMPLVQLPGGQLAYVPSRALTFTAVPESTMPLVMMQIPSSQAGLVPTVGLSPGMPFPVNNQDIVLLPDAFEVIRRVSRCDKIGSQSKDETCPVCLESFSEGQKTRTMPCFHCLHDRCAKNYFRSPGVQPVCPLCRFDARKVFATENL